MTPNPEDLLDILRCPANGLRLRLATPELIRELETRRAGAGLRTLAGKPVDEPLRAGLVREDGLVFYPVREGIPMLLIEESILLDKTGSPL